MTQKDRLLEIRKNMKKKKPKFRRVESWRYGRVKDSWRKARGIDSQTRKKTKSGVKSPSVGYRSPKKIRGLHPSGYEEARVEVLSDLENLNPHKHAIKIASRLGARKRMEIIDNAQKKNFRILNIGVTQREMEEYEALLESSLEGLEEDEDYLDEEDFEEYFDEEDIDDED
jgi:large subunit ribosomal protein L32e